MIFLPNNLNLDIDWSFKSNAQALQLTDNTSVYNIANLGGYNYPNPSVLKATSAVLNLQIPDSNTYTPNGNSIYQINLFASIPTSAVPPVPYAALPTDIGLLSNDQFPDGIYLGKVVIEFIYPFAGVSWSKISTVVTVTTANIFKIGQLIVITTSSDLTNLPLGTYTITAANAATFTFSVAGSNSSGTLTATSAYYEATSTFYLININGICNCQSKLAAKSSCSCGSDEAFQLLQINALISVILNDFKLGLWCKAGKLIAQALSICGGLGCGCGCND